MGLPYNATPSNQGSLNGKNFKILKPCSILGALKAALYHFTARIEILASLNLMVPRPHGVTECHVHLNRQKSPYAKFRLQGTPQWPGRRSTKRSLDRIVFSVASSPIYHAKCQSRKRYALSIKTPKPMLSSCLSKEISNLHSFKLQRTQRGKSEVDLGGMIPSLTASALMKTVLDFRCFRGLKAPKNIAATSWI